MDKIHSFAALNKLNKSHRVENAREWLLWPRRRDNSGRVLQQLEVKELLNHMKDNEKKLKRSLTAASFIN